MEENWVGTAGEPVEQLFHGALHHCGEVGCSYGY